MTDDTLTPDEVVIAFLDAVYDGYGELAAASFNEQVVLKDATELIVDLRELLREARDGETRAHEMTVLVEGELDARQDVIRSLTTALRGLPYRGVSAVAPGHDCWMAYLYDDVGSTIAAIRGNDQEGVQETALAFERALAEMGVSEGKYPTPQSLDPVRFDKHTLRQAVRGKPNAPTLAAMKEAEGER